MVGVCVITAFNSCVSQNISTVCQPNLCYLHEVAEAPLTKHIFEEDQVLFVVCIRVELRGEQGQGLMQPYTLSIKKNVLEH